MDKFKVATWNVFAGTPVTVLEGVLRGIENQGVTIMGQQEAGGQDITRMMRDHGWHTHLYDPRNDQPPQWRISWRPEVWQDVLLGGVQLSETSWARKSDHKRMFSQMATGIFCDMVGQTLDFGSFHDPAHIQPRDRREARYNAAVESHIKRGELADDSRCKGVLYVGDTNWDTDTGPQTDDTDPVFRGLETGLREIQPPSGTHGKRQIDNMYIIRGGALRPSKGLDLVRPGGGDHKVFMREFAWR